MLYRSAAKRRRFRRGIAALEFGITLPFLAAMFALACDFSRLFYYDVALFDCARNGALWLSDWRNQDPTLRESPFATVNAATLAAWPGGAPAPTVTASAAPVPPAPGQQVWVEVQWNFPMVTSYLGFGTLPLRRHVEMLALPEPPTQ
jgi:Flp pilus assembly protein TadG